MRMFKIFKLIKTNNLLKPFFDALSISSGFLRLIKTVALVFFLTHMMSCFWFLSSNLQDERSWIDANGVNDKPPEI